MANKSAWNQGIFTRKIQLEEFEYSYDEISSIRDFLQELTDVKPKVGIICGSGLGCLAELDSISFEIDYKDIPNFPTTSVQSHLGKLIFGYISSVPVVCMQGRFHYYEGYSLSTCIMPVRLMKLLGITYLIATNAAGGLNQSFKPGDLMLLKDHFNIMGLSGISSLRGLNDPRWGNRFFSMVNAYNSDILCAAKIIAKQIGIDQNIHEGVYSCAGGPTYETIAESRALKGFGVDAIGMSTVHEVTAARHCDIKCFAFSLITNMCPLEYDEAEVIEEEQVLKIAKEKEMLLKNFISNIIAYIGKLKE